MVAWQPASGTTKSFMVQCLDDNHRWHKSSNTNCPELPHLLRNWLQEWDIQILPKTQ